MDARPLPIGLAYVSAYIDRDRHTVNTMDLMFSSDEYLDDVSKQIQEFNPDIVGISMRNLSNHSYVDPQWQLPITKAVIEKVREQSKAIVICGGPAFSILPTECFDYVEPDFGIVGDAGEAFSELVNRIEIGEPSYLNLEGLVYRSNGLTITNDGRCLSTFDRSPDLTALDMDRYNQAGFGIGVLTKLGGYYYPKSLEGLHDKDAAWRVIRPIPEVIEEVIHLERSYGIKKAFFIDNCFNFPLNHAKDLCRALIESDVGFHWNTCLAPFGCDDELMSLMKKAGCALVLMGTSEGDPHEGGGPSVEDNLRETCLMCEKWDLHYTISQRFGSPGETRQTVETKLAFLKSLRPALVNIRVGVSLMPGTSEARIAMSQGLINSETDLICPTFYIDPEVKPWLQDRLAVETSNNPRWNLF
jgi:hypothetical protein